MNNPLRVSLSSLAFLTLALQLGCGDESNPGGGGAGATGSGGSPNSGGGGAAATGGTSLGGGGAGGDISNPPATLGTEKMGSPLWEPADYHQFSVTVGSQFENFGDVIAAVLPPPNHQNHPNLGVGPGAPHAGPYDVELATTIAALGYEEHSTWPFADGALPKAILSVWMMVPSAGAPTGSSPDFASGPIIPNTIFPIHVQVDAYADGVMLQGYSYAFNVPPLDASLDPPFNVDGHSHFPMFDAGAFDGLPSIPGTLETHIVMTDAAGDGWTLTTTSNAVP
ncbi:MAG: hypothetical protein U0271_46405 [Polyangiaceae bacterium]